MPILNIVAINHFFGGVQALSDFSLSVELGEVVGIIGPNGAGKTTLLNIISGIILPQKGYILFLEHSLVGLPPERIFQLGISRTFQNLRLFLGMSVLENVLVGLHTKIGGDWIRGLFWSRKFKRTEQQAYERAMQILYEIGLEKFADMPAGSLPYADRRRLEIGRALAADPKIIMLDEPTSGMSINEISQIAEWIHVIKNKQITVILVSHGMELIRAVCGRVCMVSYGVKIAEGSPEEVLNHPKVVEAYLGKEQINGMFT